jgi:hypothetical protein
LLLSQHTFLATLRRRSPAMPEQNNEASRIISILSNTPSQPVNLYPFRSTNTLHNPRSDRLLGWQTPKDANHAPNARPKETLLLAETPTQRPL